jgi:hypothetical protein
MKRTLLIVFVVTLLLWLLGWISGRVEFWCLVILFALWLVSTLRKPAS